MSVASRVIEREQHSLWSEFWTIKALLLQVFGLHVEFGRYCAQVFRGDALLATFTHADIPADIDACLVNLITPKTRLAELVGGAA